MNNLKTFLLVSASLVLLLSFNPSKMLKNNGISKTIKMEQDTLKWVAPASANELINPYEENEENRAVGKLVYRKHCRSCHGRTGEGDGVEAANLDTPVGDFTDASFIEQTDGSMFWKISEGRNDMEAFNKKLEEEDIWLVTRYIKTLAMVSQE